MKVTIVPVAHVSEESVRRVRRTIEKERPQCVAIELDPQRLHALLRRKEPTWLELVTHPFFAMLYLFQKVLGKGLGITPGSEMLAAVEVARELDIPIVLLDRDIGVTMSRLARIPLSEKLALVAQMFLSPLAFIPNPLAKERPPTIEEMTEQRFIRKFFREFRESLPNTYRVLVEERDEHMFEQLRKLNVESVVLVIGAGHVPGMARRLRTLRKEEKAGVAS